MEKEMQIANTFFNMYKKEYGVKIDEMKLHKLMYFAQRESLMESDVPLFAEEFRGWKYGPVLISIRNAYKYNLFNSLVQSLSDVEQEIITRVFEKYASKSSWSLSRLTHSEYSWLQSRKKYADGENGNEVIKISDIKIDAERIKSRRIMREKMGLN